MDLGTRVRVCIGLLAATLCLASCGGDQPAPAPIPSGEDLNDVVLTAAQDGGSTALLVGQGVRVELPADPETGCAWQVVSVDAAVLRAPPMEEFVPPDPDSLKQGGTSIWRFTALKPGRTAVTLRYVCLEEGEEGGGSTFRFTVIVD